MKKSLNIYLFRHGQSTYNKEKKFTGFHNPPLTKKGIQQAHIIANKLKNKQFQLAIQTRLKRSKQTLSIVLKSHPECKIIKTDNRMTERNYGQLNGTKHEEYIKKYGKEQFNKIHRDFYTRPPKGESFSDVEKRVSPFIKDIIDLMKKNKTNLAISAHGNSIRLFRKIMEKASVKQACKWTIPYDKVYTYRIEV